VQPHIRVRVISKKLGGGCYYNKKGRVEDVTSQTTFILVMDSGQLIENVHQPEVETVIPKTGGRVVILAANRDHKGEVGKLMDRSTKKATALVQLDSDLSVVKFSFDHIAEYLA